MRNIRELRRKGKILSYRWKNAGIPENGRPTVEFLRT